MQRLPMALLIDRLFTIEGKPVKERTAEEKAEALRIRSQLAAAIPQMLHEAGVKQADKADYTQAVQDDHA